MDLSERNKKVAIARWNKIRQSEKEKIPSDDKSLLFKAALWGFLAGDGSVQARKIGNYTKYQIDFFPDDKIMLNQYLTAIKIVYNKIPPVKKKGKMFIVRISSKTMGEDLLKDVNFGIKKWRIPLEKLNTLELKVNWLRAFFSAEGYVNEEAIKLQTVNEEGMKQLSTLLNEISIEHKSYHYKPKNEKHNTNYIIMIIKKEAKKNFYKKVGFWHATKMQILKKAISE